MHIEEQMDVRLGLAYESARACPRSAARQRHSKPVHTAEREPVGHPDAHGGPHARARSRSRRSRHTEPPWSSSCRQVSCRACPAWLIAGGYAPDTPAAIVYKATWPDERSCGQRSQTSPKPVREGITKTALITVGGFLGTEYRRSKLYDPTFTTGLVRQADEARKICILYPVRRTDWPKRR